MIKRAAISAIAALSCTYCLLTAYLRLVAFNSKKVQGAGVEPAWGEL